MGINFDEDNILILIATKTAPNFSTLNSPSFINFILHGFLLIHIALGCDPIHRPSLDARILTSKQTIYDSHFLTLP